MAATNRLTLALLKQRITRALAEMRAACAGLDFDKAQRAEREMNAGLEDFGRRLRGV